MNRRTLLISSAAALVAGAACSQAEATSFAAGDADWTPFDFFRETRIFMQGHVNGHATEILLDSGAGMTCLDKAFADAIGIKADANIPVQGAGGTVQGGYARGIDISIGGFVLKNSNALILDFGPVAAKMGHAMPVVLGRSVFDAAVVDIDFPNQRIAFRDPEAFKAPAGAVALPLAQTATGVRDVMVSLEGKAPVASTFDLGNGSALLVSQPYAAQEKLLEGRRSSTTLSGGVGGLSVHDVAMVKRLSLGGVDLKDVPAVINRDPRELPSRGLNVGISVWKRFRLMVDYRRATLWLTPDARAVATPFRKDRTGLGAQPNADHLLVAHVAPGGPGEAAGFKVGDRIVAVDAAPVTPEFIRGPGGFWGSGPAGATVKLTLADGTVRALTLADYY
ncbi:MAG: aspartyl protease family protein [Proteobacteria bacterium]|nr:aspartyl protease family protein [Pseudomonadota bacterium]